MNKKKLAALAVCMLMLSGCTEGSSETADTTVSETEETAVTTVTTTETTTVTTTEATTITTTETTTETEPEFIFEDTPENAYDKLMLSFISGDIMEEPDDYGGTYSYFGKLYVNITTEEPSEYYTELLGDYTCVEYKTVKHSVGELSRIINKAVEVLEADPEGRFMVVEEYIDYPSNKAAIALLDADPKAAQNYLKTVPDLGFEIGDLLITVYEEEELTEE